MKKTLVLGKGVWKRQIGCTGARLRIQEVASKVCLTKKPLLLRVVVSVLITLGIGLAIAIELYQDVRRMEEESKRDGEELSYKTARKWEWSNRHYRLQIARPDDFHKNTVMRRVYLEEKHAVYVWKEDINRFVVKADFETKCEPNSEIETEVKRSNGSAVYLTCDETGHSLSATVRFETEDQSSLPRSLPIVTWQQNFGGFQVHENFLEWDFTELDREATLRKARKVQGASGSDRVDKQKI